MSWNNKVTWSEGLFLRPQLFQQQERYLEYYSHRRAKALSPFYWGLDEFQIDHESLLLGKLVLARASGLYVDGTPFDIPGQGVPPPPLSLTNEHLNQVIYLGLSIRTPNGEETTFDDAPGSLARYNVYDTDLRDSNSIGQGPKPVQLSTLRLRLIPAKELSSAWMGMPLARVTSIRSDGSAEIDANLIPPVNRYGASELLMRWVVQMQGLASQRAQMLADRLSGAGSAGGAQAAEVTDFLLLQILNRCTAQLSHVLKVTETSPEALYILLRGLAAELSTFVRTDTRLPAAVPDYNHTDPYASFKPLVDDLRLLLNNVSVRSAQSIPLVLRSHGLRLASIDPKDLESFSGLVLAVAASVPAAQVALQFPSISKMGPADQLPELVRLHLPGVPLGVLPVPPRQIPYNSGFVYFQIQRQGALWERMLSTGGIGLHIATELPQLQIELWGIRS